MLLKPLPRKQGGLTRSADPAGPEEVDDGGPTEMLGPKRRQQFEGGTGST